MGWLACVAWFLPIILNGAVTKIPEITLTYWTDAIVLRGNSVNAFWIGIWGACVAASLICFTIAIMDLALWSKTHSIWHILLRRILMPDSDTTKRQCAARKTIDDGHGGSTVFLHVY